MLNRWQKIVLAVSLLAVAAFAASFAYAPAYEICGPSQYTHEKECATYHAGPFALLWGMHILDDHNGLVTAIATIFIAGFTATLYSVTGRAVKLANDEFVATHRPKIFVHSVAVTAKGRRGNPRIDRPFEPARAIITIVNGGESWATIIEWCAVIYYQSPQAAFTPRLGDSQKPQADAPLIVPGQWEDLGHNQANVVDSDWEQFVAEGGRMFFIGKITYEGPDKIRRNTGFCREHDAKDAGAWRRVTDSEYEYAY
jgi:hypothetical protein